MSCDITLNEQSLWVSNQRLSTLLAFALQVGGESARSDEDHRHVDRLRRFEEQARPGISFDLDERFPELAEKKFWAGVFQDVARRIFRRQIGNHDSLSWQSSAIGDAYAIVRMLTGAVQAIELAWHPVTEETREAASRTMDGSREAFHMPKSTTLSPAEIESLDRFYREGGLRAMASPHVHYDDPNCPRPGCGHRMEWIDFKLELHGDPEGVYKPLVRSWWEGTGFVGLCPSCGGPIRFTTLGMTAPVEGDAARLPHLPANWAEVAQIG